MVYFSDHLVEDGAAANPHEDYYQSGAESPGQWYGSGAKALGLVGEVGIEDMARALLGVDQANNKLVQNGGNPERRAGFDLTFSAPKSVSLVWGLADGELRQQIANAHQKAVQVALRKLESEYLFSRRGHGGEELENARLVSATFDHWTSREQDPQCHTHSFVMNLAQRADGTFGTIQSSEFFQAKMALGALYRAEFASQLQTICLQDANKPLTVERDGKSFRLAGMDPALEKALSKCRTKIEKSLDEKGMNGGKASEIAALDTRSAKESIATDVLRQSWKDQAAALGHTLESILQDLADAELEEPLQMPTPEAILAELTERASTVSKSQLQAAVYQHAQGVMGAEESEQYLQELLHHDQLVTLRDREGRPRYTTLEMYNLEKRLAADAQKRSQERHHQSSQGAVDQALAARPTITDEQKMMLEHITGPEGFCAVQGWAGTGKSFTLGAAREAWKADGKHVVGCALGGKQADELEAGAAIPSQTIHSLINDLENGYQSLTKNSVLVIDEAGVAGSRLLKEITDKANAANAKIILCGDAYQTQAIDAGGAFRLVSQTIGAVEITENRRQRDAWARQAVQDFRNGEAGKALRAYAERGLVHVEQQSHDALLEKLVANHLQERDPQHPGENLMIAATRRDVALLNQLARSELQATGEVQADAVAINGTNYAEGDRIIFTRNNRLVAVKNGVLGSVVSAAPDRFEVMTDAGKRVHFNPQEFEHFQHGYAITCHKSQGVTVDRAHVLINEGMSDRHWSYVAASRAREQTQFYATSDTYKEAAKTMARSHLKDTSQDYQIYPAREYQNDQSNPYPTPEHCRKIAEATGSLSELSARHLAGLSLSERARDLDEYSNLLSDHALSDRSPDHDLRRHDDSATPRAEEPRERGVSQLIDRPHQPDQEKEMLTPDEEKAVERTRKRTEEDYAEAEREFNKMLRELREKTGEAHTEEAHAEHQVEHEKEKPESEHHEKLEKEEHKGKAHEHDHDNHHDHEPTLQEMGEQAEQDREAALAAIEGGEGVTRESAEAEYEAE